MVFSWVLVFATLMVHTRATNKLKRAKKNQKPGEFVPLDESGSDDDSIDSDMLMEEESTPSGSRQEAPATRVSKGVPTAAEKGKSPMQHLPMKRKAVAKRKSRVRGIKFEESPSPDPSSPVRHVTVNTDRLKSFENRECIGERHVDIHALCIRSPEFGILIKQAHLIQVCKFADTTGYCSHLVRTFYANAQQLKESDGGPMEFFTSVRGISLKITPHLIGEVLEMESSVTGLSFLKGMCLTETSFRQVRDGICLPNTQTTNFLVYSKELRLEYKFLNFMVCYNVLPNMQTKILRWDRMLFLYLLGHPMEAIGLNINIPYIIWNRMARYVEHPHNPERLPFPLIIMRILRKRGVDISSTSYQYSSGKIDESTVVKSMKTKVAETMTPSPSPLKFPAHASAGASSQPVPPSEGDISVNLIYQEQRRMRLEQERIVKTQRDMHEELEIITTAQINITRKCNSFQKILHKISDKLGCDWSDESDSD